MMKTIQIPYYTSSLDLHVEESNLEAVITAKTDSFDPGMSEAALVEQALATGYIAESDVELLHEWRKDPANWKK